MLSYWAVIECDHYKIRDDLSHWLFTSYLKALAFAEEMRKSNADYPLDYQFVIVELRKKTL